MARSTNARRVYGTGSIVEHAGAFYGKWRVDGRQVKRKLGAVRQPGAAGGLTRKQAERRLRELMAETVAPASSEALTFELAGTRDLTSPGWRVSPAQQVPQAPTRTPAKSPCRWPAGEVSLARAEGVVAPREPCRRGVGGGPVSTGRATTAVATNCSRKSADYAARAVMQSGVVGLGALVVDGEARDVTGEETRAIRQAPWQV